MKFSLQTLAMHTAAENICILIVRILKEGIDGFITQGKKVVAYSSWGLKLWLDLVSLFLSSIGI